MSAADTHFRCGTLVYTKVGLFTLFGWLADTAAGLPMVMRLLPHDRFGQFCSANAMCTALGTMLGGVLAGVFLDSMKSLFGSGDYYYRFVPVWSVGFMLLALIALSMIFREWKKLGGDASYRPPAVGKLDPLPVQ